MPAPVQEKAEEFDRDVAVRGTVALDEEAEIAVFEGTRASAARLIGAEPDEVAITASATLALGQIAWFLRPGRGDNVVSVDLGFRARRIRGCASRKTRAPRCGSCKDGQSRRDSPSRTSPPWSTGARRSCASATCSTRRDTVSTRRGSRRSHEHDAVLVLDASQSAGAVPIDVRADDVDFLVATSYKWLCSSFGAAICYVRSELVGDFRPPLVGWRSAEVPYALDAVDMRLPASARKLEFSTSGYGAGVALGSAIEYFLAVGIDRVLAHDLALASRLRDGLEEARRRDPHTERGRAADRNRDGAFPRPGRRGSQHA